MDYLFILVSFNWFNGEEMALHAGRDSFLTFLLPTLVITEAENSTFQILFQRAVLFSHKWEGLNYEKRRHVITFPTNYTVVWDAYNEAPSCLNTMGCAEFWKLLSAPLKL